MSKMALLGFQISVAIIIVGPLLLIGMHQVVSANSIYRAEPICVGGSAEHTGERSGEARHRLNV